MAVVLGWDLASNAVTSWGGRCTYDKGVCQRVGWTNPRCTKECVRTECVRTAVDSGQVPQRIMRMKLLPPRNEEGRGAAIHSECVRACECVYAFAARVRTSVDCDAAKVEDVESERAERQRVADVPRAARAVLVVHQPGGIKGLLDGVKALGAKRDPVLFEGRTHVHLVAQCPDQDAYI